jgi:hypothetical protein
MNRSTLALVESPTQLLNVAEWAYASGEAADVAIAVLAPKDAHTRQQLRRVGELIRPLALAPIVYPVRTRSAGALTGTSRLTVRVARARRLVLGDPFSRFIQTLLPASRASEIVVVDDGTATWEFTRCVNAGRPLVRWGVPVVGAERRAARATRLLSPSAERELTVFSCLNDATPLAATGLANRYEWTRRWHRPEVVDDEVDVLGVSLVDKGVVERAPYVAAVSGLVRRYGRVRYLAHRRESTSLVAEIGALPGVRVARNDLPVELELRRGFVARSVVTFPSTATHTLPVVLADVGVTVQVCRIDPSWFVAGTSRPTRDFVARIADAAPRSRTLQVV